MGDLLELKRLMDRYQEVSQGSPWALEVSSTIAPRVELIDRVGGFKAGHVEDRVILTLFDLGLPPERRVVIMDEVVPDLAGAVRAIIEGIELNVAGELAGWLGPESGPWMGLPGPWMPFVNEAATQAWRSWLWARIR
jgi:hypothetical protein